MITQRGVPVMCAKTAERTEVLLGYETLGGPRNIVLDGSPYPTMATAVGKILSTVTYSNFQTDSPGYVLPDATFVKLFWRLVNYN